MLKIRLPFFSDGDGASGSSDGSENSANSDENQNTGENSTVNEQEVFQKGFNTATAKFKQKLDEQKPLLEELAALKAAKETQEQDEQQKELESQKNYEQALNNVKESYQVKIDDLSEKLTSKDGSLNNLIVNAELYKLASKFKVLPKAVDKFVLDLANHVSYEEVKADNGKIIYDVYPLYNGSRALSPKSGEQLSLEDYVKSYVEENDFFVEAKFSGGSGSKNTNSGVTGSSPINANDAIRRGLAKRKQQ